MTIIYTQGRRGGKRRLFLWLNKIADELDRRYGPHPMVPRSQVKVIAREMLMASDEPSKEQFWAILSSQIDQAFKGTELDK